MAETVKMVLSKLADLVLPLETWDQKPGSSVQWLNKTIEDRLNLFTNQDETFFKICEENNIPFQFNYNYKNPTYHADNQWVYVENCLAYLTAVKMILTEKSSNGLANESNIQMCNLPKGKDVSFATSSRSLTATEKQNLSSLIHLVMAFGVMPYLLPGVGLPIERRKNCCPVLHEYTRLGMKSSNNGEETEAKVVVEQNQKRLGCVIEHLVDLSKLDV